jgi:type II secretory pathway component PulM
MEKLRLLIRKILESPAVQRMSSRERLMVAIAASVLVLFILYMAMVNPFLSRISKYHNQIEIQKTRLQEIVELRQEYQALRQKLQSHEQKMVGRGDEFSLPTFLENAAQNAGFKIESLEQAGAAPSTGPYKESSVQLRFNRISYPQLLDFLESIENADYYINVKKINIKARFDNPDYLNVSMVVSLFQMS